MPTRRGSKIKKRNNRENNVRDFQSNDKGRKVEQNDDPVDGMGEYEDIDDKFDYDSDPSYTDHVYSSNRIAAGNGNNRYLGRNARRVTSQGQLRNAQAQLTTFTESEGEPSKPRLNESVTEQALNDRQLLQEILKIFSRDMSTIAIRQTLIEIQDEEERYLEPKDKHGNRTTPTKRNSFPRRPVIEHFQQVGFADFEQKDGKKILKYLQRPILKKSSYGILVYNSKKEILVVQDHNEEWSAPKGHRKINANYQLETIKETATRKFNQEIRVTNRITNEIYNVKDIDKDSHFERRKYLEFLFDDIRRRDIPQSIGLFIIEIDESKFTFDLPDTYENQKCQWFKLNEILDHVPQGNSDIFCSLRPFVERFQEILMFNGYNSFTH